MGDHEICVAPGSDPLRKTVGNTLRQCFYVRSPRQNDFRFSFFFERLSDRNDISETLQRMQRSTFQAYHRNPRIFYKLLDKKFAVIFCFVFERRESSDAKYIKIFPKYRRCIFDMLNCVSAHNYFFLKLECPTFIAHIENNHLHTEMLCC